MDHPTLTVPLREDDCGVLRVGESRVRLDTVITAWKQGDSAEQIAENFDALDLTDIYAVIGYDLSAQEEVEAYLSENVRESAKLRAQFSSSSQIGLRQRLLARHDRTLS